MAVRSGSSDDAASQPQRIFSQQLSKGHTSLPAGVAFLSRTTFPLRLATLFTLVGIVQGRLIEAAPRSHGPRPLSILTACPRTLSQQGQAGGSPGGRLAELSLEQLGNIEVTTASKEPEEVWRTPAAIFVITQEDIRRSGATSIPEVLRLAPGVEVARIDSDHWSIGVRGFGSQFSRDVLVLIDGRNVYNPLVGGVYWEVQDTLIEDIDRIEVIRGPGGTIWGPDAVNAVINIITKRAQDTKGTLLELGGGNVDQGIVGFRYGSSNGRGFGYRLYGKTFTRGPEFHLDHDNFDRWRMGQAGFRADWDRSRDTFTLQGDLYDEDTGESVLIPSYSPPFGRDVEDKAELSGGNLLGHWRRTLGEGSDLELTAYYDRTYKRYSAYEDRRQRFDVDFIHHLPLRWGQDFIWGFELRRGSAYDPEVVPVLLLTPSHNAATLYSGFVQDEIPLVGHRLTLTLGSKFWHSGPSGLQAEPTARLLWTPTSHQTAWAAVTRAVATPSLLELGLQESAFFEVNPLTFLRVIGNRDIASEELNGYEAGYRTLVKPNLYLDVAAFYNDYPDLESFEPGAPFLETTPGPPHFVLPYFLRNGLKGTTHGFEIAPEWKPVAWWQLKGSYSYLHMNLERKPWSLDPVERASLQGSSPTHQVVFQSLVNLPKRFEFDQTCRYVSALPAQQVASYSTADARFGWRPNPHLEFSLTGDNLLQPHHAEFGGDPGPLVEVKRSAYGRVVLQW